MRSIQMALYRYSSFPLLLKRALLYFLQCIEQTVYKMHRFYSLFCCDICLVLLAFNSENLTHLFLRFCGSITSTEIWRMQS